jgi:hypothetical protein
MSTGAGVLRQVLARATHLRASAAARAAEPAITPAADASINALVHQVFFASEEHSRKRVLFAAVDSGTQLSKLCERIAMTLAELSGSPVALVNAEAVLNNKEQFDSVQRHARPFHGAAIQIHHNVWNVPFNLLDEEFGNGIGDTQPNRNSEPYVVFGASISDQAAPLFCKSCDGAVLVLSANNTRREAAVRAKETLTGWNVELLGAVLDGRTFPVPEFLYRRL